jgi:hypothetical protein
MPTPADIGWDRSSLAGTRSELPPGGSPAGDKAFLSDIERITTEEHEHWCEGGFPHTLPDCRDVPWWQVMSHLHKWCIGWSWPDGEGPSRAHRIRFVAIQWAMRPQDMETEARRYIREKRHEYCPKD